MSDSCASDQHGNQWRLNLALDPVGQAYVQVLAADGDGEWQALPEEQRPPEEDWARLASDDCGFIWIENDKSRFRFDPRRPDKGWLPAEGATPFDNDERDASRSWKELARLPAGNHDIVSVIAHHLALIGIEATAEGDQLHRITRRRNCGSGLHRTGMAVVAVDIEGRNR